MGLEYPIYGRWGESKLDMLRAFLKRPFFLYDPNNDTYIKNYSVITWLDLMCMNDFERRYIYELYTKGYLHELFNGDYP